MDSTKKFAIHTLARINVLLALKHGDIFNIEGKAPSWDWAIKKLDEIITAYKKKGNSRPPF